MGAMPRGGPRAWIVRMILENGAPTGLNQIVDVCADARENIGKVDKVRAESQIQSGCFVFARAP